MFKLLHESGTPHIASIRITWKLFNSDSLAHQIKILHSKIQESVFLRIFQPFKIYKLFELLCFKARFGNHQHELVYSL